jgi:hypothetical protein
MLVLLSACGPMRPVMAVQEFPPTLPAFGSLANGGRTQAIAVDPRDAGTIVLATQWGGLWKRSGTTWRHVGSLPAVFAQDVAFSPEGTTIYATLARDNRVDNGGGIWRSLDGAATWTRAPSAKPPAAPGVPARVSAYGIAVDRYRRDRVYVATDYGIAITTDAGATWRHVPLIAATPVAAKSVLDLPGDIVLATSVAGVHRSTDGGQTWAVLRAGNFSAGFKALDNAERAAYPLGRPRDPAAASTPRARAWSSCCRTSRPSSSTTMATGASPGSRRRPEAAAVRSCACREPTTTRPSSSGWVQG